MGELLRNEGLSTCVDINTSYVEGERYEAVRNNANNTWYVNVGNGNVNNNNTNNRYNVVGASGASESILDMDGWEHAECSFFKNKHKSVDAQRIYIHPSKILNIAREVEKGTYVPRPGYRFPIIEPSPREIYAAFCNDRLVHHYIAPFINEIAEKIHMSNGNISHGNRIGHSAQTGAEQIRDIIKNHDECTIVKIDFYGFFNSINRQQAYDILKIYAEKYYNKSDLDGL